MRKLLTLILLTFALTGAGPLASAWEREAFKALKGIKDMATEQAKQEKAAKEQAERDEQERAAREKAEQERAKKEQAEQAEQAKLEAERAKLEAERAKLAAERQKWEQERQQEERADSDPQADKAEQAERERNEAAARERVAREQAERDRAEREQAERDRAAKERAEQAAIEQAERERQQAERERVEQAGGMSCYAVALIEYAFESKGLTVLSDQQGNAKIAEQKEICFGDPNEPPADFQEAWALGPRHCHIPMMANILQEQILIKLRDEAAELEKKYDALFLEEKRQAAEKKLDALFLEAAEVGCIEKETVDAYHADKAKRAKAARVKAWCEQNGDRRTSGMNCVEMANAMKCREAAWKAARKKRNLAASNLKAAMQTADATDPKSMAEIDRLQAERDEAIQQTNIERERAHDVIYDGVKNHCPTQAWGVEYDLVHNAHRLNDRLERLEKARER